MTWRQMTTRYEYDGTQLWYRTDSYYDSASYMAMSTWGPGVILSANAWTGDDNNGATNKGKTYVWAYADGSGVQLVHLTYATTAPSGNTTAGAGTNALVTGPASFNNTPGGMFCDNYCSTATLLLEGTTDTSTLVTAVQDYSDGYKATSTMALEMLLNGAAGGWRGVCIVYYTAQYVQSAVNGSVCHAVMADSGTAKGPQDFGASYLMHVPANTWSPPAKTAAVTPSGQAITDAKYAIVHTPSTATAYLMTQGYYASVVWYQPKYASSYTLVARYGKDDYVGAYCMQGASTTSWFSAPAGGVQLTGAVTLAAGAIALGALTLAM